MQHSKLFPIFSKSCSIFSLLAIFANWSSDFLLEVAKIILSKYWEFLIRSINKAIVSLPWIFKVALFGNLWHLLLTTSIAPTLFTKLFEKTNPESSPGSMNFLDWESNNSMNCKIEYIFFFPPL